MAGKTKWDWARWAVAAVSLGVGLLAGARGVRAGAVVIGPLTPAPAVSPSISGIVFDTNSNPLVLDQNAWTLQRIDKTTAAVLATSSSSPASSLNDELAYDSATGGYYTIRSRNTLTWIDPVTLNNTDVGPLGGTFNGFNGLSEDPAGNLWFTEDQTGTSHLWMIDKGTGLASGARTIPGFVDVRTLMIASDGTFYGAGHAAFFDDGGEGIYRINPNTGVATFLTSTMPSGPQLLVSLAEDPISHRIYGVREDRNSSPFGYALVEVTGIPEPTFGCGTIIIAMMGLRIRVRRA
jgi:hypothetical protein